MTSGTYTLLVALSADATIAVGSLGSHAFPAGWYAYTGSAFGTGGFARVARHRELAAGERDARHWHVDYLLGHPAARVVDDVRSVGRDVECAVARALPEGPVDGFGASDCDCESHLAYAADHDSLLRAARKAHETAR